MYVCGYVHHVGTYVHVHVPVGAISKWVLLGVVRNAGMVCALKIIFSGTPVVQVMNNRITLSHCIVCMVTMQ